MKRCPITYQEIPENFSYSEKGLILLSRNLKELHGLPYTAEEQLMEAQQRSVKMSIQGVQPKLSAKLNVKNGIFEIVNTKGSYILKPQHYSYPELPENEDLTMRLAKEAGVDVPLHGLVYSADQSFSYFIKRFDRFGRGKKRLQEDFAQLIDRTRDTKYDSSMEQVTKVIETYCTFPAIEKVELFRRVIFCYLVGNEDMHLKNFSLITKKGKVTLSPAYDLLNSSIYLSGEMEELALPLNGKKRKLVSEDFIEYFGQERLQLQSSIIKSVFEDFEKAFPVWEILISCSFLSEEKKGEYLDMIAERRSVLRSFKPSGAI